MTFFAPTFAFAPHAFAAPPVYVRRASPCSFNPCFAFVLFFVFAPCVVRIALFALATVINLTCLAAPVLLAVALTHVLTNDSFCCSGSEEHDTKRRAAQPSATSCGPDVQKAACLAKMMKAACFAKMKKEAAKDGCPCNTSTTQDKAASHRRDLSSARVEETADGVRVTVAAPGVKPEDLEVTIVEQTLRIKGETTINGDVFAVDRHIVPPRNMDPDSAECTHTHGVLTVTLKRVPGKVIRVNASAAVSTPVVEEELVAGTPIEVEDANESSEGEWVESVPATKKKAV